MREKGQSVLDYAIILALVSAAFVSMAMYVRRAVQGTIYHIDDRIIPRSNQIPGYMPPGAGLPW